MQATCETSDFRKFGSRINFDWFLKAIKLVGSKIPGRSLVIHIKTWHAQFSRKSDIFGLQIGSFQERSFPDRCMVNRKEDPGYEGVEITDAKVT